MIKYVVVAIIILSTYILFVGSTSLYTLITGLIVSATLSVVSAGYLIANEQKLKEPIRLIYLIYYFVKYITVIEFKAHMDVIKRIFTMDIKPGIVRVPVNLKSRYSRLLVMGSITNTPGTVVVDEKGDFFYVNWIKVTTTDPVGARKAISKEFEDYAYRVFE